jgi:hypothetical protein
MGTILLILVRFIVLKIHNPRKLLSQNGQMWRTIKSGANRWRAVSFGSVCRVYATVFL